MARFPSLTQLHCPETYLKKYFKKLIGMKDIEDALSRLDILTQEEVKMATAQILKLAHRIKGGVEAVSEEVKGVGDKVNRAIEGMSSTSATQNATVNRHTTRWKRVEIYATTSGGQYGQR